MLARVAVAGDVGSRTLDGMAVARSELRLVWPPALFAAEAMALLAAGADDDALGGLLDEAFHDGRGEQLLRQIAARHPLPPSSEGLSDNPWAGIANVANQWAFPRRQTARMVEGLARDADRLPRHRPRPLFRQRQQPSTGTMLDAAACAQGFAVLVGELVGLGYFEDTFGGECPDSGEAPDRKGQQWLAARLGLPDVALWPLHAWSDSAPRPSGVHERWPDGVLLDVVEALDEVVARPRQRSWHGFHQDWDYADYVRPAGQAIYRWRVNDLLDRSSLGLRLATAGEDAGLLVYATGDPRDELVEQALAGPQEADRDDLAHAVRLFRSRIVTREDKRSAVVALAGVLERRRARLKAELLAKDEGALFQIANTFDLRHRDRSQQGDYDEAFLDWVFWWYLATVELTDRLLAGQAVDVSGA